MNACKKKESQNLGRSNQKNIKLSECANQKYSRHDPRQISRVNAIASMICRDAEPTNIVNQEGFKHAVEALDSRFVLPVSSTFSRSILPKRKEVVSTFSKLLNDIRKLCIKKNAFY